MYGGDEVSAIVVDIGSDTTKAGYAGEDTPKSVFTSSLGVLEGEEGAKQYFVDDLNYRRDKLEVVSPFTDGLITDWDGYGNIWEYVLGSRLRVQSMEHPLMVAEPVFNSRQNREKMVQYLFEKHSPPALFVAKNPVLSSFSAGRPTSVVVDVAHGAVVVSPVQDGYALLKGTVRSPLAGHALSKIMLKTVEAAGTPFRPRYSFKRKQLASGSWEVADVDTGVTTDSFRLFKQLEIAGDMKEAVCRVMEVPLKEEENATIPTAPYELPDGNTVEVGLERFKVPELMFNPSLLSSIPGASEIAAPEGGLKGLTALVNDCISKCDVDLKKDFLQGILLTGGSSLFPGLKERLEREMVETCPSSAKVRLTVSQSQAERKYSVWIGGSILASLGSVQQLWMSKAEFEEHGPSLVNRKCP